MDISAIFKNTGQVLKRNSSTILTGFAVAGSVGATILAVKATPKALVHLEEAFVVKNGIDFDEDPEDHGVLPLTVIEVVKATWKDYAPAAGMEIITIACVVGAQSINLRRQAALISAFSLSEAAWREYQERIVAEKPSVDRKVRDDIAQARVDKNPPPSSEILIAGDGDQLFYDKHTDRYFKSTMNKVQKAVNEINSRINNQSYAALNEFYHLLDMKSVAQGDDMGWTPEHSLELDYSTTLTEDDRAAIVIDFLHRPFAGMFRGFQ